MRRIWAGLVLSLSLAAVLTGCAGDTAKNPAHSPSPSPENTVAEDMQRAGENVKRGVERAGDDLSRAADDMKDSFDRMVDNGRVR